MRLYFRVLSLFAWIIIFLICISVWLGIYAFGQYQTVEALKFQSMLQQAQIENCRSPLTTFPFDPKLK